MSWATCSHGHRHWGARGAAGLLLVDRDRVLLQLRAHWTHQGGTWSIPGGARERGESAVQAALREAHEEVGISPDAVRVLGTHVASCGGWDYTTVLAAPTGTVRVRNLAETEQHAWVAAEEVVSLPLHPAFSLAWQAEPSRLREFAASA
jgi:8-oxo-dGTP diphosphatase